MTRSIPTVLLFAFVCLAAACGKEAPSKVAPAGATTTAVTDTLKAGSAAIQRHAPVDAMNVYVVGFHPMKSDPEHQMEAHHFCRQVNEDFAQCALFDGNSAQANLTGVEYIISEKLFEALPEAEKRYWHPHNAEILSGQLVGPGLPEAAEKELMRRKMNSYGKTWHVWMTDKGDQVPMGDATLAWSFNRDGEARPNLIEERDKKLAINTPEKRKNRQDLRELARPQMGVDDLEGKFGRPVQAIPGVVDKRAASGPTTRALPPPK